MADVLNIAGGQQPDQVRQVDGPGRPALVHVLRPVVLPQAGTPLPHKTGSCSALLNWYQKNRPDCVMKDPQPGDIAIFTFGHTGIVERALPWLTAMVGLPWTAHGTVCAFYLNMAKSDHKEGGITFETARAAGFQESGNSPSI